MLPTTEKKCNMKLLFLLEVLCHPRIFYKEANYKGPTRKPKSKGPGKSAQNTIIRL